MKKLCCCNLFNGTLKWPMQLDYNKKMFDTTKLQLKSVRCNKIIIFKNSIQLDKQVTMDMIFS
jgi:hypothetical protein